MRAPLTSVRLDKWLWAVRIFKTRTAAAEACRGHKVIIGGHACKPSRDLRLEEFVEVRKDGITRRFKVLALADQRVSAEVARGLAEDLTDPAELERLRQRREDQSLAFHKGGSRPSKKERRALEKFLGLRAEE